MSSNPPAPDLGATRERMDRLIETLAFLIGNSAARDLKALVTAYDAQRARLAAAERLLADQDYALATQAVRLAQLRTVGTRLVEALTHGAPEETFTALRLELTRRLAPPDAIGAVRAGEVADGE